MPHRDELTRFLKSARARIRPSEVGLPAGERRRIGGLRREEVASLAGMSVTWYTWFEQGREVQLSAAMLERLSTVLQLSAQEREFLFALAQHRPAPLRDEDDRTVSPGVQHLMDTIGIPALVMASDWTVIGWNWLTRRVFRDYPTLAPMERNLLKILLLSPQYQGDDEEFRAMAERLIARFKWDYSRAPEDGSFNGIIAELEQSSSIFRELWKRSEIIAYFEGTHRADVAGIGPIVFHHTSYTVEQSPSQRLVLFAPIDADNAAKLERLAQERAG